MVKLTFIAIGLLVQTVSFIKGHTWIDCLDTERSVVYDNGSKWIYGGSAANGICKGYTYNYPGRSDPNLDLSMTHKMLKASVEQGTELCKGSPNYSGWRHRLQVQPGQKFWYGYLENGHVSKDKAGRGTFYGVYWTGKPDTSLTTTKDISQDKLIDGQLHDFDDGNCGQTYEDGDFSGSILSGRAGNNFPCVGEVTMPPGTAPGIYNLVWFWKFYDEDDGKNGNIRTDRGSYGGAAYSSCFQVEVLPGQGDSPGMVQLPPDEQQQNPEGANVSELAQVDSTEQTSAPETQAPPEETPAPETQPPETQPPPEETQAPEAQVPPEETPAPETQAPPQETTAAPEETQAPSEETTETPGQVQAPPEETTAAPEETQVPPEETTTAPEETQGTSEETSQGGTCTEKASKGDVENGINLITDAGCGKGGLGCTSKICRLCKMTETPKSAHLQACPQNYVQQDAYVNHKDCESGL